MTELSGFTPAVSFALAGALHMCKSCMALWAVRATMRTYHISIIFIYEQKKAKPKTYKAKEEVDYHDRRPATGRRCNRLGVCMA